MATYESANVESVEVEQSTLSEPLSQSGALPIVNIPVVLVGGRIYPMIYTNMMSGVLPVKKGGTGLDSLSGGRLLASNENGTLLEEIDVGVDLFSGLKENIQDQLNRTRSYVVTVPATGWSYDSTTGEYSKTIAVKGITADDNPVVGFTSSATTVDALKAERLAFECMDIVTTAKDSITIKCLSDAPQSSFSISIICNGT